MQDHKEKILRVLSNLGDKFSCVKDPNETIDSLFKNFRRKPHFKWYPTYLFVCGKKFFMFRPFCSEGFLNKSEILKECRKAQILIDRLKTNGIEPRIFFITDSGSDVSALSQLKLPDDFGILHNEYDDPVIDFNIRESFNARCRILPVILQYLSNANNLKGNIGVSVREFAKSYLKNKPTPDEEEKFIEKYLRRFLKGNRSVQVSLDLLTLLKEIEHMLIQEPNGKVNIRDHYFHALNTMMVGFVVLDKYYKIFSDLAKRYGRDIEVEFLWALISLFHDIGKIASLEKEISYKAYGVGQEEITEEVEDQLKQNLKQKRLSFCTLGSHSQMINALDDLFSHIFKGKRSRWRYDAFRHSNRSSYFKEDLKDSFVKEGAHGAVGALRVAVFINENIEKIQDPHNREFLYRHLMIASLSILFHDIEVRKNFKRLSGKIRSDRFPLSVLLTYIDILQDDRRDLKVTSYKPDILIDVCLHKGQLLATVNPNALTPGIREKMLFELRDMLSFFKMSQISFGIPKEIKKIRI